MRLFLVIVLLSFLLNSCTFIIGATAGGAIGYYIGKEGYKVKVEKEK